MTAAETRYGRRGGGWLPAPTTPAKGKTWARPTVGDQRPRAHPDRIAEDRAREQRREVTPADVAAVWAGRRRMATARQDAGRPLDDLDRQALAR